MIDLGLYELHDDYIKNYQTAFENAKESIFEVQFIAGTGNNEGNWVPSYTGPGGNKYAVDAERNMPIIRYAEVLLIYAEALNELGQAAAAAPYLKKVRECAGLDDLIGLDKTHSEKLLCRKDG